MAARKTVSKNVQPAELDIAAFVDAHIGSIQEKETKAGLYLPWTFYQEEVSSLLKVLTSDGKIVSTHVLRELLIKLIEQKIERMPAGTTKVLDFVGLVSKTMSQKEWKELRESQFSMSRSSKPGPGFSRVLGGQGARVWLAKRGFVYNGGVWTHVVTESDAKAQIEALRAEREAQKKEESITPPSDEST